MNARENVLAALRYEPYERMPVVYFGYWDETLAKWAAEGHIGKEVPEGFYDGCPADRALATKIGFDINWGGLCYGGRSGLFPAFEETLIETRPDGSRIIRNGEGLIEMVKPGVISIPAEIGTGLTDREAWEREYLPKLQWSPERAADVLARCKTAPAPEQRTEPLGVYCGSMMGTMRNLLGVTQLSYLWADDEDLFVEICHTMGEMCYLCTKAILESGVKFDFAHYWEDICFKNGPLVSPKVFAEVVGPLYARTTQLLHEHGVDLISLDCDGCIDSLIPTWLQNGVNVMFPIEVGTWGGNIEPWRAQYGKALRGLGGMDKRVFAADRAAVDAEIERLRRLIDLGGYVPCVDHRIAPDAKYDLVCYYAEKMRKI